MYPRFIQTFLDKQLNGLPTHKEKYDASFHTKKVFANMKRIGKEFSGKETPLFSTMKVLDLEDELKRTKTAQQTKIAGLEKRVKKLEKKHRSRTHKLKRLYKVGLTVRVTQASKRKEVMIQVPKETTTTKIASSQQSQIQDKESNSKRAGDELDQEISKKQKVEDDKESEELKKYLEIIPDDGDE
nr:hypothetical protein [Tanacetum cinerariifolium]